MPFVPITMPQLGESIAEATIVSLLAEEGEPIDGDTDLFEVETNKAVMGVTAPCSGTLHTITALIGESYRVGATLGFIEVSAEAATAAGITPLNTIPTQESLEAETSSNSVETIQQQKAPSDASDQEPATVASSASSVGTSVTTSTASRKTTEAAVFSSLFPSGPLAISGLSPRVRALLTQHQLQPADLSTITGSGEGGRITSDDLEYFLTKEAQQPSLPASAMRLAVASAMQRSWQRPIANIGMSLLLEPLLAHRREVAQTGAQKPGPALYLVRALALALTETAESRFLAGRLLGDKIVAPSSIDIGVAVEVEDGVMVPVLRNAAERSFEELNKEYHCFVATARKRRLTGADTEGGIATVTNYGVFGITAATPIPLPHQTLLLGMGAGEKKPRWNTSSKTFDPVTEAPLTLSFDHRILDGGAAGRLLQKIKQLLESPKKLA